MDEKRSNAVTEAFVRLHKQGLLYRYARHRVGEHLFLIVLFPSSDLYASWNITILDKNII